MLDRLLWFFILLIAPRCILSAILPTPGLAQEPLRCALVPDPALGLKDSAAFNLLTVELSRQPGLSLLERAEVDRVLQERALGLALAAEGVAERRNLGALLKARLLVLLRAGEREVAGQKRRWIDVALCDTATGIRIDQDSVAWDEGAPEGAAKMLIERVRLGRMRRATPLRAIVAVPPLVSDDLLHTYDAMQDAYARLVIENFMSAAGVQVVELAEARALVDEQRLAAADSVRRPLSAYFVSGRYRNEGSGPNRRITLSLELSGGQGKPLVRKGEALAPGAEAALIEDACRQMLVRMLMTTAPAFNPLREADELIRRAGVLEQLGECDRALGLVEAALLIQPAQADVQRRAAALCGAVANASYRDPATDPKAFAEAARHGLATALRGLEHLEFYLNSLEDEKFRTAPGKLRYVPLDDTAFHPFMEGFWRAGTKIAEHRAADPEIQRLVTELGKAKRELILRIYERMAARKQANMIDYWASHDVVEQRRQPGSLTFILNSTRPDIDYFLFDCTPIDETPEETYAARLRAIDLCRRIKGPAATGAVQDYASYHLDRTTPAYQAMLAKLEAMSNEEPWKAMMANLLKETQGAAVQQAKYAKADQFRPTPLVHGTPAPAPTPALAGDEYRIEPIPEIKQWLSGWMACEGGLDLIWTKRQVCAMRQPGKLEVVYNAPPEDPVIRVVYDGRYVWASQAGHLTVVDPASGAADRVDAKNGLPPGAMQLAPLAPGRVCVVGAQDRAWCALVDYAPGGKSKVDIFHEARLQTGEWTDPALAFQPSFAVTIRDPQGAPRVLVGRYCVGRASHLPLLLDPARRTAEVLPERFSNMIRMPAIAQHNGCAWWIEHTADLQAGDGISENQAQPPAPDFNKLTEELSAKARAEARATGKKLQAVEKAQMTIQMDTVSLIPNRHISRLVRFGGPGLQREIVLNNLPELFFYHNAVGMSEVSYNLVGFLNGQCYILAGDCWWADLERGRAVKLKGPGHLGSAGGARLFQSNHYGLVYQADRMEDMRYCYRIAPAFDPAALRAEIDGGNPNKRAVQAPDPLEGRPLVARCYPDPIQAPDAFTTHTSRIDGTAFMLEREAAPRGSMLVLLADDQPDPELRKLLAGAVCMFPMDIHRLRYRDIRTNDSPAVFALEPEGLSEVAPQKLALQDALGRPLLGYKVRLGYTEQPRESGLRPEKPRFFIGPIRADEAGQIAMPILWRDSISQLEWPKQIEIRSPKIGVARFCDWFIVDGAFPKAEEISIRLPLTTGKERAQELQGAVVDASGKPVAGALVQCTKIVRPGKELPLNKGRRIAPAPDLSFPAPILALSDREGRFRLYPVENGAPPKTGFKKGTRFEVRARHPAATGKSALTVSFENTKEHVITLSEAPPDSPKDVVNKLNR